MQITLTYPTLQLLSVLLLLPFIHGFFFSQVDLLISRVGVSLTVKVHFV